jgi:transcriptional regulator with XRE-family HTH domain
MLNREEMCLGKKIRLYRKKAGLTQEVMAEKLGLSSKYIQFIENGQRRPSLKVVYKIAKILEIDICNINNAIIFCNIFFLFMTVFPFFK